MCLIARLNVLIAVVSDSYDLAMTRAENLFLRTRLELVAELDSLGFTTVEGSRLPAVVARALQGRWGSRAVDFFFRLEDPKSRVAAGAVGALHGGGGFGNTTQVGSFSKGRINHMEFRTRKVVDQSVGEVVDLIAAQRADVGDIAARLTQLEARLVKSLGRLKQRKRTKTKAPALAKDRSMGSRAGAKVGDTSESDDDDDDVDDSSKDDGGLLDDDSDSD